MYPTGIDPFTGQELIVGKQLRDLGGQRALLHSLEPENYFEVRKALEQAGRQELIGGGCDQANAALDGNHVHTNPTGKGYRPGRATARRRDRK